MTSSTLDFIREQLKKEIFLWRPRLIEFLKIPSISTASQYKNDVLKAHDWLLEELNNLGFFVQSIETSRYPVILAHLKGPEATPHVMLYGHYDVQPADPENLWIHPPFEPHIDETGEIYARGAQDNKGQLWAVIQSIRVLKESNRLPCNITLCVEGEEESGSTGLMNILDSIKEKVKADALFVVDVEVPGKNSPGVTLGCRGNITMTLELEGSNGDLHSGMHGGIVFNPLHALVQILSSLRSPDGTILIEDFYKDVKELSKEEKDEISFHFDPVAYEKEIGAKSNGGEKAFSPLESCWIRPTLEINGLSGGYAGEGFKTVIPAKATAKISCRLVPDQDPEIIFKGIEKRLKELTPEGIKLKIIRHGGGKPARASPRSKSVKAARKAYAEAFEKPCVCTLSGGSIPVTAKLADVAEAEILFMGYGLSSDNIHAPNEHYGTDRIIALASIIGATLENYTEMSNE